MAPTGIERRLRDMLITIPQALSSETTHTKGSFCLVAVSSSAIVKVAEPSPERSRIGFAGYKDRTAMAEGIPQPTTPLAPQVIHRAGEESHMAIWNHCPMFPPSTSKKVSSVTTERTASMMCRPVIGGVGGAGASTHALRKSRYRRLASLSQTAFPPCPAASRASASWPRPVRASQSSDTSGSRF